MCMNKLLLMWQLRYFSGKKDCAGFVVPTNNQIRSQSLETDPRNVEISKKGESENRA